MGKTCFIITPIGGDGEPIRREIEGIINTVIAPVVKIFGFDDPIVAHKIVTPGSINNQIIDHIVNDDLVIVNLTGLNPNVMYELAIRHATKKPVIHICLKGTELPFDIKLERTIFYTNDIMGAAELGEHLKNFIEAVSKQDKWDDNPIYTGLRVNLFKNAIIDTESEGKSINQSKYMMDSMALILKRLDNIEASTDKYKIDKINSNKWINVNDYVTTLDYDKVKIIPNNNYVVVDGKLISKKEYDFNTKILEDKNENNE
jgi:hypothetical protein